MRYGYVRNQDAELLAQQLNVILKDGIDEVVIDTKGKRLPELLDRLKKGDSLSIASLDRLTRDLQGSVKIIERLHKKGVTLYVDGKRFKPSPVLAFLSAMK